MALPQKALRELKARVALANRILANEGLADYHGHVSARIPGTNRFLIKPVLKPLAEVTARDILIVEIDAYKKMIPEQRKRFDTRAGVIAEARPPRETIIHAAAYEARPDVNGVVHTHQLFAAAFGLARRPILPVHNTAGALYPGTPILDNSRLLITGEDGKQMVEALGQASALLLRGHGVVLVAPSVEEVTVNTIYLERAAKVQLIASLLGHEGGLSAEDSAVHTQNIRRRAEHAFAYFASLLR